MVEIRRGEMTRERGVAAAVVVAVVAAAVAAAVAVAVVAAAVVGAVVAAATAGVVVSATAFTRTLAGFFVTDFTAVDIIANPCLGPPLFFKF
jgi:dihydroxyacetone kinase